MNLRFPSVALMLFPVMCSAAPFQNGSFESPRPAAPNPNNDYIKTFAFNPVGSEATGWTFTGNAGVFTGRGTFEGFGPVDGYQHVNFSGGNTAPNGVLRQTFDTVTTTDYVVSFWAGRTSTGTGVAGVTVKALQSSGVLIKKLDAMPAAGSGYVLYQFTFRPMGASTILSIEDISAAPAMNVDILLDAVSVYPATQTAAPTLTPYAAAASVVGNVNALYRLDVADELANDPAASNWRILTYIYLPVSPYQFLDPDAAGKAKRFYRLNPLTTLPP